MYNELKINWMVVVFFSKKTDIVHTQLLIIYYTIFSISVYRGIMDDNTFLKLQTLLGKL